jgi:hypothetical protein
MSWSQGSIMTEGHPKDKDTAYRFLERLDPEHHFTFQTFGDCESDDSQLVRVLHGSLEEHFQALVDLNKRGAGIFVTGNRTDSKGRKAENITETRAVFVDLDGAPLTPVLDFGLRPHIIVQSSPDRWHAYWLCSKLPLEDFNEIQKNIAHRFGGDHSIVDLPRVMRVPGFQHLKKEPFLVQIEQLDDFEPYEAAEIRHWLGNTGYQSKDTKEIEGRNSYLFSRACSMRKSGLSDIEIRRDIDSINQEADPKTCPNFSQGPLPKNEVAAICKSAMGDGYAPDQNGVADPLYYISGNQLVRRERTTKGSREIIMSNFTAEIVEDICRDDSAGEVRGYNLKAKLHTGEPLPSVTVPTGRFNSMGWVPDSFGARACIKVGMTNQQHTAAAIQYLSRPSQRLIYRLSTEEREQQRISPHGTEDATEDG